MLLNAVLKRRPGVTPPPPAQWRSVDGNTCVISGAKYIIKRKLHVVTMRAEYVYVFVFFYVVFRAMVIRIDTIRTQAVCDDNFPFPIRRHCGGTRVIIF